VRDFLLLHRGDYGPSSEDSGALMDSRFWRRSFMLQGALLLGPILAAYGGDADGALQVSAQLPAEREPGDDRAC